MIFIHKNIILNLIALFILIFTFFSPSSK